MASGLVLDTDSEDDLPPGWEERVTEDGRVYYASHESRQTQWKHPLTGRKKVVSPEMPYGWEKKTTTDGKVCYFNNITRKMTSTDPRLAYTSDVKNNDGQIRQRFDASSTALQVLQGRDLTGSYVIITGANSGIGFETARSLALHGAHVTLACRNMRSANSAVKTIQNEQPAAQVEAMFVDLTSLRTVKQFAANYINKQLPLHILILNAGVFSMPYTLTDDGYETTFQTNHLGHFYLVQLLTSVLVRSAPARVVVVSSESHRFTDLKEDTLSEAFLSPPRQLYWPIFAYNQSKMANLLFVFELHQRRSSQGIRSYAVHPGNLVATRLTRHWWFWRILFMLVRPFAKSKQQAAATSVYCATARELEQISGYYFNNCFHCSVSPEATNAKTAKRLWELSELMVSNGRTLQPEQNETKLNCIDV